MANKLYIAEFDAKSNAYFSRLNEMESKTKASATRINQMFGNVGGAITKIGGAMAAVGAISFLKASIDEAIESQKYLEKLERAYGKLSDSMKNYIDNLELTTRFSDADITSAMSRIATYVKEEDMLKSLTEATMDFAAVKDMDLTSAAELVTKTIVGSTNALSRYGIEIDTTASAVERANDIIRQFAIYQGEATLSNESMVDQLMLMNKEFENVKENVGNELLPILVEVFRTVHQVVYAIKVFYETIAGEREFKDLFIPIEKLMVLDKQRKENSLRLLEETKKSFGKIKAQFEIGINEHDIKNSIKSFSDRLKIIGTDKTEESKIKTNTEKKKYRREQIEQDITYITRYARYKDVDKSAVEQLSKELQPPLLFDGKMFAEQVRESMVKVNDVGAEMLKTWAEESAQMFKDKFADVQNIAYNVQSIFNIAADTFVGKLISGVETVAQILDLISSVKSLFGVTTIAGVFDKGGSVVNSNGNVSITSFPKFATGGSFVVPPGYSNDTYPMFVRSGERVDITPISQTMNITSMLKQINNSIKASTMTAVKYNNANKPMLINLQLDGRTLATKVISADNKFVKSGMNKDEL